MSGIGQLEEEAVEEAKVVTGEKPPRPMMVWITGTIDYAAIVEILINHIGFPDEEIQATTLQWIAELLLNGPGALGEIKALFAQLEVGPITPAVRELTAQTIARVRMGDEAREGFAAFLAKRPAAWVPHKD